jgi:hydroxymethylglutaryl-CoA lyase
MSTYVRITDVAPRDGLQNEPDAIPVAQKVELIRLLVAAGVDEVEVGSFVSPRWVPQMAGTPEVCAALAAQASEWVRPASAGPVLFSALTPNLQGAEAALRINDEAGRVLLGKLSVFTAASEEFARRNTNASIAETIERFRPVADLARRAGLLLRGYVSCVVACPFAGAIEPWQVVEVSLRLLDLGVEELDWGDTIGAATPESTEALLTALADDLPRAAFEAATLHLHDTFGRAAACVQTALQAGMRSFDGAAGGLGGCPYASTPQQRAPGNLATERLVAAVNAAGLSTGVDGGRLALAAEFARTLRKNS